MFYKPHSQQEALLRSGPRGIRSRGLSANHASCPCISSSADQGHRPTSPLAREGRPPAGLSRLETVDAPPRGNAQEVVGNQEWGASHGLLIQVLGMRETVSPPKGPRPLSLGRETELATWPCPWQASSWRPGSRLSLGCLHPASGPEGPPTFTALSLAVSS